MFDIFIDMFANMSIVSILLALWFILILLWLYQIVKRYQDKHLWSMHK